jgi:myo-inositol-1(or 4)-monophosphatase
MSNYNQHLAVALKAAKISGSFLLSKFGKIKTISSKTRNDILTEADLKSEKIILGMIGQKFPGHNILSEEIGRKNDFKSEYLWVIDPLDATVNYVSGIPLFSVSIGLIKSGKPILGVVFAPYLKELFYAVAGGGSFLNKFKIHVSKISELSSSVVNVGLSAHYSKPLIKRTWKINQIITPELRGIRMLESGALTSCYVACGRFDGKISIKTDPFGNAASTVIIQEAGGIVTDFQNQPWSISMKEMVCSNGLIHKKLLACVNK